MRTNVEPCSVSLTARGRSITPWARCPFRWRQPPLLCQGCLVKRATVLVLVVPRPPSSSPTLVLPAPPALLRCCAEPLGQRGLSGGGGGRRGHRLPRGARLLTMLFRGCAAALLATTSTRFSPISTDFGQLRSLPFEHILRMFWHSQSPMHLAGSSGHQDEGQQHHPDDRGKAEEEVHGERAEDDRAPPRDQAAQVPGAEP